MLYAHEIRRMLRMLQRAEHYATKVRTDSGPEQAIRCEIIAESIATVRDTLLRAAVIDVEAEPTTLEQAA
jgi:hypothetical protein